MKKVININFQGRVIPIEETAYDMLTQYVESLRIFFANEEGKDEIINDIEGRIAELFAETLKKGSTCITDADVAKIIESMGRPQDFDADEANVKQQLAGEKTTHEEQKSYSYTNTGNKKLYRDETHRFLGGVCSGIANYFSIDPVIVRIIFIVTVGFSWIVYLILWVAVPSSSSVVIGSQRKRLFRDPDNKMLAGVCSGLAQYFSVQVWIPRVLFLIPFFSFVFRWNHWGWWDFPHFLSFSFSPGAVVIYIILWLILPEAKSAADKLEMKGEKVDLNNIKTTIQGDLEGFKDRAQQLGSDLKEKAQEFGQNFSNTSKQFTTETGPAARRVGSSIGRVLVVLIKAFAYLIVGSIILSIVVGLFAGGAALTGLLPAYSYVLNDGIQTVLAWGTLILFIWIPIIAFVTWIIRMISGKKGNKGIIRLTFLSLWILGLICFVNLIASIRNDFRYRNYPAEQAVHLSNPGIDKLEIKTVAFGRYYTGSWFNMEPFASFDEDTAYVRNIRLRIIKSDNDSFKVSIIKMANGQTKAMAENSASRIDYNIIQKDSVLLLDRGIAITRNEKFRNQQVIINVAVPVGKRIYINDNVNEGDNIRMDFSRNDDYWDWENAEESHAFRWRQNVEYVMTLSGLEKVDKQLRDDEDDNNDNSGDDAVEEFRKSKQQIEKEKQQKIKELQDIDRELEKADTTEQYHYHAPDRTQSPANTQPKAKPATKNTAAVDLPIGINNVINLRADI